jgi:hypothetical protein
MVFVSYSGKNFGTICIVIEKEIQLIAFYLMSNLNMINVSTFNAKILLAA